MTGARCIMVRVMRRTQLHWKVSWCHQVSNSPVPPHPPQLHLATFQTLCNAPGTTPGAYGSCAMGQPAQQTAPEQSLLSVHSQQPACAHLATRMN